VEDSNVKSLDFQAGGVARFKRSKLKMKPADDFEQGGWNIRLYTASCPSI
jgi:hypothetical protein